MSPFTWHLTRVIPAIVFVFTVTLLVYTIMFTYQVHDAVEKGDTSKIDDTMLEFVRYGHFVEAGVLATGVLVVLTGIGSNMYVSHRMSKITIDDVGLK